MELKKLNVLNLNTNKVELTDVLVTPEDIAIELQILPGKYQVMQSLTDEEDIHDRKIRNLFIVHESINKDLEKLNWEKTDSFKSNKHDDENSIGFLGHGINYNDVELEFDSNEQSVKVVNNGVFFSFLYVGSNDGLNYSTITENGVIKGFKIEVDTLSNEINRQFLDACASGDIETVKALTDAHSQQINIHYQHDEAFYLACRFGRKDVVKYLLFSPDLKENVKISEEFNSTTNAFAELCTRYLSIVESLIMEHNFPKTPEIEKFLDSRSHDNIALVKNMFKLKEITDAKDSLDKELPTKEEQHNRKPKI